MWLLARLFLEKEEKQYFYPLNVRMFPLQTWNRIYLYHVKFSMEFNVLLALIISANFFEFFGLWTKKYYFFFSSLFYHEIFWISKLISSKGRWDLNSYHFTQLKIKLCDSDIFFLIILSFKVYEICVFLLLNFWKRTFKMQLQWSSISLGFIGSTDPPDTYASL